MYNNSDLSNEVFSLIDKEKKTIIDFIKKLLDIPSENHVVGGDEIEAQKFLESYFKNLNLEVDTFLPTEVKNIKKHVGWWNGDNYDNRPNVVAIWKGNGKGKSLIINGHIDTVEAGPIELWETPPYEASIRKGRLYARGAVDMKGALGASAALLGLLINNGYNIDGDLIIESVVGEEFGWFNGSLSCIERGYKADAAIIPEATDLRIALGTKGICSYRIVIPGKGTHQSLWWEGVSALDNLIKIKEILKKFQNIRANECSDHKLYGLKTGYPVPALSDDIYYLNVGNPNLMAVPAMAVADFIVEVLPGEDREEILKRFEKFIKNECAKDEFLKKNKIDLKRLLYRPVYPTSVSSDLEILKTIENSVNDVKGVSAKKYGFESSCDAMMFNMYSSTPAIIFGPGKLEQAHRPNEFIKIDDLIDYTKILADMIISFCGIKKI